MDKGITPGTNINVALEIYYVSAINEISINGASMGKPGTFCGEIGFFLLSKKTDTSKSPKCKYSALSKSCTMNRFGNIARFEAEGFLLSNSGKIVYSEFAMAQGCRLFH